MSYVLEKGTWHTKNPSQVCQTWYVSPIYYFFCSITY